MCLLRLSSTPTAGCMLTLKVILSLKSNSITGSTMDRQKILESLNREFEDFFKFCRASSFSEQEMNKICSSLYNELKLKQLKKFGFYVMGIVVLIWLCINVNFLNWSFSALGRIVMIKFLPLWDWTYLYNANCLISYPKRRPEQSLTYGGNGFDDLDKRNCALCENLKNIAEINDSTFQYIEERFLEKGHPVIITNSHLPQPFHDFLENIISYENYIETDPCDVESNLLLTRFVNIDDLLNKAKSSDAQSDPDPWFFHLRNCQFEGVKASRKFTPKPHYHPAHLPPFYSSWLLMSSGVAASEKRLYVKGLVVVMQISGRLEIILTARKPCFDLCGYHQVGLSEGEALVYLTDIWEFSYVLNNDGNSATIITETKWE